MNLILLSSGDFIGNSNRIRLTGRRQAHILEIHRAKRGDVLSVGLINDRTGTGRVTAIDKHSIEMEVELNTAPPQALPLTLILALPRPQVIKRVLLCASSLGIKKIILLNFFRVEKSLWQSSSLRDDAIREQLVLGLEQAKDTVMPEVILKKSFKKFAEEELPDLMKDTLPLVAHPGVSEPCPRNIKRPVTLVIGPEGGFIDDELKKLTELKFKAVDLGPRILRVESVLPFIIGKLF